MTRAHGEVDLGGQHVVLAAVEEPAEQASGDLLARAGRVGVGRVEERDAAVDRRLDDRLGCGLVEVPGPFGLAAVTHHAQADPGDLQPGRTQPYIIHFMPSRSFLMQCFPVQGDTEYYQDDARDVLDGGDLAQHDRAAALTRPMPPRTYQPA